MTGIGGYAVRHAHFCINQLICSRAVDAVSSASRNSQSEVLVDTETAACITDGPTYSLLWQAELQLLVSGLLLRQCYSAKKQIHYLVQKIQILGTILGTAFLFCDVLLFSVHYSLHHYVMAIKQCWQEVVDELLLLQMSELALCCLSLTMLNTCRKFVLSW